MIFLFCSTLLFSQPPYEWSWKNESIIVGSGLASLGIGSLIHSNTKTFTIEEIYALDRSSVNRFDIGATFNWSTNAANVSDYFVLGSHLVPLIFLTKTESRKDFGKIALLYGETVLITDGLTLLTKRVFKRPRPFVYNEQADINKKLNREAKYSFFSGHTSITAANCFFFAKVYSDYYPDSELKPWIWGTAAVIPAITGYLRVRAGKHYASDVMTGYAVGGLLGFLIPHVHKVDRSNRWRLSSRNNKIVFNYKF